MPSTSMLENRIKNRIYFMKMNSDPKRQMFYFI